MSICQECKKEFKTKRTDAKFCSPKCKMKFIRNKNVDVTDNSVTDNVTDNLLEHIEESTVEELKRERMWIPNWKRSGTKSLMDAKLDLLTQMLQIDHGRFSFLGSDFE